MNNKKSNKPNKIYSTFTLERSHREKLARYSKATKQNRSKIMRALIETLDLPQGTEAQNAQPNAA